ncbi:MAG: hypothetical protein CMF22_12045 [Idiomarinaceae bacterium]|nr:hypothetical protein [Idiomarinaceae bacterium]|tara:strand:+ start:7174 stop:8121 length:948 start_codon:yes stop_codon:yes gene_type:complete
MNTNPMQNRQNMSELSTMTTEDAWTTAIDAVNFPVYVKPLTFEHEEETYQAEGNTNTGRNTKFYGIVVDRDRTGVLSTITTVTGLYGTLPTAQVYHDLMTELTQMGVDAHPTHLYLSGSGGQQQLNVAIKGQLSPDCMNTINMHVQLITSVDGSRRHTVRLLAVDEKTGSEVIGVCNEMFDLNIRHTKAIHESHVAFSAIISTMITQWNDEIMPFINLMGDAKMDRSMALTIVDESMKAAKVADKVIDEAKTFVGEAVDSSDVSGIQVLTGLSDFMRSKYDDNDKNARGDDIRSRLNKKVMDRMEKLLIKLGMEA